MKLKQLMQQSKAGFLAVVLLYATVSVPPAVMLVGCAKSKLERQSYQTLYAVGSTANVAVDTWLRYFLLNSHKVSKSSLPDDEKQAKLSSLKSQDESVQRVYQQFQASYNTALTAAQLNVTNLAPAEVTRLCLDLAAMVTQFTDN